MFKPYSPKNTLIAFLISQAFERWSCTALASSFLYKSRGSLVDTAMASLELSRLSTLDIASFDIKVILMVIALFSINN